MKSTPLLDIVELLIRKEKLEAIVAEGGDKAGEQRLKLQRAQRDVTDYSGRLKYGGAGGITPSDIADLKQKGDAAAEAASQAAKQLASLELDSKNAVDDLHNVRQQIDSLMNQLKMRYCAASLSEKGSAGSARASSRQEDDGGGSKQPIAASFTENIHKIADELRVLLVGGGKHPFLKLFVNDLPPINDAAPHYSSWEQRTLTTIFNAKEKVLKIHQRLTDAVNTCAVYYPDLAKNSVLWTDFVDLCDDSFLAALRDNIERALVLYERALGGKSAPELFSVNLKLTAACRVQLVPTAHELPNHVVALVEEKLFSIVPPNTIGDVVSAPTTHKSGKGVPLKKILSDKGILSKLEVVKNHVARYGEELVAAVVKIEDRFLPYWNQDAVAKMTMIDLRKARDEVEFDFGYIRQRIFNGAFQLNAFPLQDTLSALLTSQIDARRQLEANTSDEMLQQMIKSSTLANARAFSVPIGGLAALLQKSSGNSPSAKKSDEWSDRFDPVKYVDQLVASQIKSAHHSTLVVASSMSPLTPKTGVVVAARPALRDEKENVVRSSTDKPSHQHSTEGARDNSTLLREVARTNAVHSTLVAGKAPAATTAGGVVLGAMASPRPSSTPSNGTRSSVTTQNFSLTPNRVLGKQSSPREPHQESAAAVHSSAIRSAEVLKASVAAYTEQTQPSRPSAWDSPTNANSQPKREKPRRIDLPREPDHAPVNTLVSPYREKQATPPSVPIPNAQKPERELNFDESSVLNTSNQHQEERRAPRGILKSANAPVTPPEQPSKRPPLPMDDDDDEYTLQRLLQKEKESLERIRVMKERDDARRREIQAAHRKGVVTEETLKKVSPRSEYQALLEEQARLENARRDNEAKLREAEREARRVREEQDHQRQQQLEEEDRQQRQWEEQLRQQHEENSRRRAREKQAADEAERDALRRKVEEEEKRRQYQKDLEDRLEEELRRRAFQQQREREERELERVRREQELHQAQEGERLRQRAALERLRHSPVPQYEPESFEPLDGESSGYLPSVQETSALRRKLSLPPVQASLDGRPATPPMVPLPDVPLSARSRKPNTAPQGTPRGNVPPDVPRSTTSFGQSIELTPRERMAPIPSSGSLPERSLLDEYKQYCLNFGIKPNSGLLKSLPSVVGDFATSINLDLNYIGVKGVQPLLQILKRNRGLKLLNLKDNNLENNEVRALVNVLLTESGASLAHLDLSNNPISLAGGSAIMDLVSQKKTLTTVVLRGTLIQPKVVEKIVEAAESNRRRAAWNSGSD